MIPRPSIRQGSAWLAAALLMCGAARGGDPVAADACETRESLLESARSATGAVRLAAVERLGLLREEQALPAIRVALADTDLDLRRAAIRALGRFGRADLLAELAALTLDPDPRLAGDAVRALEPAGFAAAPFAIDALRHEASGVREAALAVVRRVTGVAAEPDVLAAALKSARGDRSAFLRSVLASSASPRAKCDALRAMPDEAPSVPGWIGALEDPAGPVREAAVRRLEGLSCRRLPDAAAWKRWLAASPEGPILAWRAAALRDAENPLRLAAARALAVPDTLAAAALLDTPAQGMLEEAILSALPEATGLLARPASSWRSWWEANRGRTRLEWLLAALLDTNDAPGRTAAARSLGAMKDLRSVEYLTQYGLKDAEATVREAAAAALERLAGARQR